MKGKLSVTMAYRLTNRHYSVADPGFSPGDAPTPKIATIFQIFAWIRQCYRINSQMSMNKIAE